MIKRPTSRALGPTDLGSSSSFSVRLQISVLQIPVHILTADDYPCPYLKSLSVTILGLLVWSAIPSSTPLLGCGHRLLSVGRFKDTLNRCIQHGVELGSGLLGRKPFYQRARKARHDAVISAKALVGFFPCITARQRNHPHDIGMADAISIQVVSFRQGDLEHDQLSRWQLVQLLEDRRFEQLFGLGLFRAANIHFGLDDRYQTSADDLLSCFELLIHNVLDALSVGLLDERAHLGSEYALCFGLVEQRAKLRHRLHELDPILLRCAALVHLDRK